MTHLEAKEEGRMSDKRADVHLVVITRKEGEKIRVGDIEFWFRKRKHGGRKYHVYIDAPLSMNIYRVNEKPGESLEGSEE